MPEPFRVLPRPCRPFPLVWLLAGAAAAQDAPPSVTGWMRPPDAIARLVESPSAPDASLSPQRRWLVLTTREPLPGLETVARPHYKLGGLRVDPASRGPQLGTRVIGIT